MFRIYVDSFISYFCLNYSFPPENHKWHHRTNIFQNRFIVAIASLEVVLSLTHVFTKDYRIINALQFHARQCDAMQFHAMPYDAMRCHAMPHDSTQFHTMPRDAMQCHTMPHDATRCHAMKDALTPHC